MSTAEKEALVTLTPELMAIPESQITYPNMPVSAFAVEMETLRETYLKDTPFYAKRNIDTAVLADKLDRGVSALRAAEIDWTKEVQLTTDANNSWKELQHEAYDLRDEAESSLDFVLPEESNTRRQLDEIREGTGHADMILDLGKLAQLCSEEATALEEIAFTAEITSRLDELYTTLTDVYGKVNSDKGDQNQARLLRDRAFVYCKEIERSIKKAARLALRKEPELLKRYRSEYQYRQNLKKRNSAAAM